MDKLPWKLPASAVEALATLVTDVARASTDAGMGSEQASRGSGTAAQAAQAGSTQRSPTGRPA
eukprot:3415138-Lingulodinium_polyedra.AAC.1